MNIHRVDRFIENFPNQIADNLRIDLTSYKEGKICKRDLMKRIRDQIETSCFMVDAYMGRLKKKKDILGKGGGR